MKYMRRLVKYSTQGYRINEDILSKIKVSPVVEKIQNYRNKCLHVRRMVRDRLPHLILKYQPCEIGSQGRALRRLFDL